LSRHGAARRRRAAATRGGDAERALSLDQFEKLSPEYQWSVQIQEVEFVVRWLWERRQTQC